MNDLNGSDSPLTFSSRGKDTAGLNPVLDWCKVQFDCLCENLQKTISAEQGDFASQAVVKLLFSAGCFSNEEFGIILADEKQVIRFSNRAFQRITGYAESEILGRNARILQGSETDKNSVDVIRRSLTQRRKVEVFLWNYHKDGTGFWNFLQISPLFNSKGKLVNWLGFIVKNPKRKFLRSMPVFPWISKDSLERQKAKGIVTFSRTESKDRSKFFDNQNIEASEEIEDRFVEPEELSISRFAFVAQTLLPTASGAFFLRAYRDEVSSSEPLAILSGDVSHRENVPLRVHDQCFTSEVLGSLKCDCREQLNFSMEFIKKNSPGIIIYLQQEGRGMGLANKIKAYSLQEFGLDTVEANRILGFEDDSREYDAVSYILNELNVKSVRLMTNNPRKITMLKENGVHITGRIPVITKSNLHSHEYMKAKLHKMGHLLNDPDYTEDTESR